MLRSVICGMICAILVSGFTLRAQEESTAPKLSAKDMEQVQIFYQEGLKFYLKRDFAKASESWQKALIIDSENEKIKEYLDKSQEKYYQAKDLQVKGLEAFQKKDYQSAAQFFGESLNINPLDARAKYMLLCCAAPGLQLEVKKDFFSPAASDNRFLVTADLSKTVPNWVNKWQLVVLDPQNNKPIRTIGSAGMPPSEIAWDVKDEGGQVYKGTRAKYALLVTAFYNERVVSSVTNAVTTDGEGPVIKVTAPDSFSPSDTTGKRPTTAMFNLDVQDGVSGVANTRIDILKSDKTTLLASIPVTGKKQFEWDGTTKPGEKAPQGEDIYYRIVAQDQAQNESKSDLAKMTVELGYAITKTGIKFNLPNIEFEKGQAVLLPTSFAVLNTVGGLLKKFESATFQVRGHTSSEGEASFNKKLSEDRAAAVVAYLKNKYRIPSDRITFEGIGSAEPLVPENTEEDKKRNRRVEVMMNGVSVQEVINK